MSRSRSDELASESRPEAFGREERIRKRAEYTRIYDTGHKVHGRFVVIFVEASPAGRSRLGITVTKKAGKAHDRNRLKRRVREIFRRSVFRKEVEQAPLDLVVNVKPVARTSSFAEFEADLLKVLRKTRRYGGS